jgi:SAM-dependent methyltransferase
MDPKRIVADGYDQIAERFLPWAEGIGGRVRERYAQVLADGLADGAAVLELGCGAGIPVARRLAERFRVTGVDISRRQIELARRNVPGATFIHGDMARQAFPPGSFDAVAAFYALTHVPREEHGPLLRDIASWLRPGGLFVASMGAGSDPGTVEAGWLGVPMYFSGYNSHAGKALVRRSGLRIERAREETIDEDGRPATFLWVVARKPGESERGAPGRRPPATTSHA